MSVIRILKSLLAGLILVSMSVAGCGGSPSGDPHAGQMVYVDVATMKPLVHETATSFPAVHPVTGKPTLRPALYCPKCQQWYPAPSVEQVNRVPGAGQCPKDKTPLVTDGPWPETPVAQAEVKK